MQLIAEYFLAKHYSRINGARVDLNIASLEAALHLVDFFDTYPLQSSKHNEFLIWRVC
jgi:LAGLIDADG endonuclease